MMGGKPMRCMPKTVVCTIFQNLFVAEMLQSLKSSFNALNAV
jgi:hypothetical protein